MFWKKNKDTELEEYVLDLEDRVRNLKRRIKEANQKMGFTEIGRKEPSFFSKPVDPPRPDIDAIKAKLLGRQ
jgi:hypothetical protein|tara:strand:- start:552 stop:767 length:216 start_codon:yes stop_codon:yes gene_type:complete